mgnify:CR=1 FL=1
MIKTTNLRQRLGAQHCVLLFPINLVERLGTLMRLVRGGAGHGTLPVARGVDHIRFGRSRFAFGLLSGRNLCRGFLGGSPVARTLFFGLLFGRRRLLTFQLVLLLFLLLLALEKTEHGGIQPHG